MENKRQNSERHDNDVLLVCDEARSCNRRKINDDLLPNKEIVEGYVFAMLTTEQIRKLVTRNQPTDVKNHIVACY
jgi:hypothetical protein